MCFAITGSAKVQLALFAALTVTRAALLVHVISFSRKKNLSVSKKDIILSSGNRAHTQHTTSPVSFIELRRMKEEAAC